MSDRERWIVYPLILLALGIALRDKITRTIDGVNLIGGESVQMDFKNGLVAGEGTHAQIDFVQGLIQAETIHCKKLVVEQELDARQIVSQSIAAKEVFVPGHDRKLLVLIGSYSADPNKPAGSEPAGGQLILFGPDGRAQVLRASGAIGGEVNLAVPLSNPEEEGLEPAPSKTEDTTPSPPEPETE